MKAFVKVEYSSEGKSPAEIERIFNEAGFKKIAGAPVFETEVEEEGQLTEKIERLHHLLKNTGIIYIPSIARPTEAQPPRSANYRERLDLWKVLGINADELVDLLEYDVEKFKARAMELFKAEVDRVALEKEKELREIRERELIERAKNMIVESARVEGGQTFQELLKIIGIDEDVLSQMIDELVEKGKIRAEQRGRRVVYIAS
jgi:DNA-binding transcriptional ArsR family regulator